MSTQSYDTNFAHSTSAEFRAWGLALHNAIVAAGLTNTADTGQIDFATVNIPGSGSGGYKIYRFNDALQATAPIFIRIDFGTYTTDIPQIYAQIGTSTDGAGNLTGTVSQAAAPVCFSDAISSLLSPFVTHVCYNSTIGYFGFGWKLGSCGLGSPGRGFLQIGRSTDSSGVPTNVGATIYTVDENQPLTPAYAQSIRFASTPAAYAKHKNYAVVVGDVTGSLTGSSVQVYLNWAHYPRVEPVNWLAAVISDEFPVGTTFLTTVVGATPRTYLSLGTTGPRSSFGAVNIARYSFAMLYE